MKPGRLSVFADTIVRAIASAVISFGCVAAIAEEADGKRQPITFDQKILEDFSAQEELDPEPPVGQIASVIQASTLVDLSNNFVCESPLKFKLGLSQDAEASITFTGENAPIGADEFLEPTDLDAGYHEFTYTDRTLRPGTYDFEVRVVSKATGREEIYPGQAIISRDYLDQLPVGHAVVEGVDLFDGSLNLSATDLQLPWSGPAFSLRRSYSSRNTDASSLGLGWSHSLDSHVKQRGCGVVTVSGGGGGGITFYPDGNGGYVPGRGYHGTLVSAAGGWDFYSKDGTQYHYANRPIAGKATLEYVRGTNGRLLKFGYSGSKEPRLDIVEDSAGRTLRFEYQPGIAGWKMLHLLTRVTALSGAEEFSIHYQYDGRGRLVESRYEKGTASRSQRYQYQVDETFQFPAATDTFFLRSAISQVIDENGEVTTYAHGLHAFPGSPLLQDQGIVVGAAPVPATQLITRPEGGTTGFEYQDRSQRNGGDLQTVVTDGRNNTTTYTLNDYGAATRIEAPNGTREIDWDLQQVVIASSTNERGITTEFAHDEHGNQIVEKLLGKTPLMTPYVTKGQFSQIKNRMAARVDRNNHRTDYNYDERGNLTDVHYPDDTSEHYTYDDLGNRKTYRDRRGNLWRYNHDQWGNVVYTRDPLGGVSEAQFNARGQKLWETDQEGRRISYTYNDLNQLTEVSRPLDDDTHYTYDLAGNKKTETDGRNHTTHWEYDGEKTKAGETTDFIFDARNHLRQVMIGGSTVGQFLYDATGLRIEKQGERGTERYTYDGQSVLTQSDANNLTLAKYNYGPNRLLSLTHITEGTQFYLFDALGSVTNLTSANGTLQARYQYDAWGNKRNETGSSWNRFGFAGHEEDKETGLIYAKARFYDPDTARFLSQDAWEGDNTLAPSLHKYLYAYQNPTVYVDPTGNVVELTQDVANEINDLNDGGAETLNNAIIRAAKALGLESSRGSVVAKARVSKTYFPPESIEALKQLASAAEYSASLLLFVKEEHDTPTSIKGAVNRAFAESDKYVPFEAQSQIQSALISAGRGSYVDVSLAAAVRDQGIELFASDNPATRLADDVAAFNRSIPYLDRGNYIIPNDRGGRQGDPLLDTVAGAWENIRTAGDGGAPTDRRLASAISAGFTVSEFVGVFKAAKLTRGIFKARGRSVSDTVEPVVTAEVRVNGAVFNDVNQTARVGANINQPTLIAERITEKIERSGKALPNGNMGTAHAEVGAIQQAFDAGSTIGADMTLTVKGKAVCGFCRGDVAAMAKQAELNSLTVYEEATGNILYWQPGMKSLKKAK